MTTLCTAAGSPGAPPTSLAGRAPDPVSEKSEGRVRPAATPSPEQVTDPVEVWADVLRP